VPHGFVPTQDKQYLVAFAQLPDAATLDRTEKVIREMADIGRKQPGVENAVQFPGLSINGFVNAPNAGIVFFTLKPFDERHGKDQYGLNIAGALNGKFSGIQDAFVAVFPPPPVNGLGQVGGFKLELEDRAGLGETALNDATQALLGKAYQTPALTGLFSSYRINVPQLEVEVDREKVKREGISLTDLFQTMQVYLGSVYANDFNRFGRTYQVKVQADAQYRATAENIAQLKVRNAQGAMVPLGSVVQVKESHGPDQGLRYNGYPAADINGGPAPGFSSGQAEAAIEAIAQEVLPNGIGYEWTDLSYQQRLSGNTAIFVFPLCVLLAFLVLAAQYESWSLPLAVILIVPMSLLCALTGIWLTKGDNNIFTQIGFLVLIGLACKNAILIVEFARELHLQGRSPVEAALEACRIRLRPILMTSFAFIMGVLPLVFSSGAGAEMRHAMGVAVFSGMLGVTFFGLMLTPVFYVTILHIVERRRARTALAEQPAREPIHA
jgi:multidrug efflux pump